MNRLKTTVTALAITTGVSLITVAAVQAQQAAPAAQQQAAAQQENNAPSVNGIPGQDIDEGKSFAAIKLDDYVSDPEDKPATIRWQVSGNKNLQVSIATNHVVTIKARNQYWTGTEDLSVTATDPKGASGSETVTFTINSVNNPPVVTKIPDRKSTRLNSSHQITSYAVFCLKKKNIPSHNNSRATFCLLQIAPCNSSSTS